MYLYITAKIDAKICNLTYKTTKFNGY